MKKFVGLIVLGGVALFMLGSLGSSVKAADDNFPPVCTNPSGNHTPLPGGDPGQSGGQGNGTGKDCDSTPTPAPTGNPSSTPSPVASPPPATTPTRPGNSSQPPSVPSTTSMTVTTPDTGADLLDVSSLLLLLVGLVLVWTGGLFMGLLVSERRHR